MAEAGAASLIADDELTPGRLAQEVGALLADPARLRTMARASARLARPDAAEEIARGVLTAIEDRGRRRS
jgi:UDP-N-acetylglucosamine--N-acetylmuramyl-(pentapeptide) pyrophosphoryl-undecaprenol N-acetylglucosamine transferase